MENNKFSLGSFGPQLTEPTFWVVLTYGLFVNLQNFGIDQSYVQRYITAKSDRDAARSVWLGAMLYIPISALLFFVGTCLFSYYATQPELLSSAGERPIKEDAVFPHFIAHQLPPGITGILIAAILAAAMSSVDSSLNCCSTLVLQDIFKRYIKPDMDERRAMRILYASTLVWGIVGTLTALAMIRISSALDVWWKLAGIFSGGMLGLFLLGIISRRPSNRAAKTAVAVSVTIILWMSISKLFVVPDDLRSFQNPLHDHLTIVVGTMSILIIGFSLSARRFSSPMRHDSNA